MRRNGKQGCGTSTCEDFALWAQARLPWLKRFLTLKNGTPSSATFYRLFRALDPKQFEAFFRRWVSQIVPAAVPPGQIAVDGKTIRGSADGARRPAHIVSAFSTDLGIAFGQEKVEQKSNEIVCHERNRRRFGGRGVSLEMRVGPSKSAYRSRFQTATSCVGKESSW